jgi:hypothetical protein
MDAGPMLQQKFKFFRQKGIDKNRASVVQMFYGLSLNFIDGTT